MRISIKIKNSVHRGFTLLETIFAVFILTVAVIGIFGLVNSAVKNISVSKNKLVAAELAQEGVEMVRWWRENGGYNAGGEADWDTTNWTGWFDADCTRSGNPLCGNFRTYLDAAHTADQQIQYCADVKCVVWNGAMPQIGTQINSLADMPTSFQLRYDTVTKLYNYTIGNPTDFYRIVNISAPQGADLYKLVTVQIIWQEHGRLCSLQVYDRLYNWLAP